MATTYRSRFSRRLPPRFKPMPLDAARGGRDRGSAVGRGELVPVSKAAHVTHLTKDPRGDQWADAMDLDQ
jgi:hypothetical protein